MTGEPGSGDAAPAPSPPSARAELSLRCTLTRHAGSPIAARAIAVGETGMRVATERPLALDETVSFDLPCGDQIIHGHARVVRQERPDLYAVRFAPLPPPMERRLREVVAELTAGA
jgi:PilZ domain